MQKQLLTFLCSSVLFASLSNAQTANWTSPKTGDTVRNLSYSANANILGRQSKVDVNFFVDPSNHKESAGALGVEVSFHNSDKITGFNFAAFEGPDGPAQAKKLMQLSVDGKPGFDAKVEASGSYSDGKTFSFTASELTRKAKSPTKSFLQSIAAGGDKVTIVITDFKNPKLKLELTVPVAEQRAAFKKLLMEVK